jgi:hypothetical protein
MSCFFYAYLFIITLNSPYSLFQMPIILKICILLRFIVRLVLDLLNIPFHYSFDFFLFYIYQIYLSTNMLVQIKREVFLSHRFNLNQF